MKIGALTNTLRDKTLDEALKILSSIGYEEIILGSGGLENLENDHCNAKKLVEDEIAYREFSSTIKKYNLTVATIACPANPLHPQKEIAEKMDEDLRYCVLLAEKMGVDNISTFSGCPGDNEHSLYPNWVTYGWPYDFAHVLEWQWKEVAIPYWSEFVSFAKKHGIKKIGMEFHPNQLVYNPYTLNKLRSAVGSEIGVCLDVSHLFWMGMDPVVVIEELRDCIWQFHAKDSVVFEHKVKLNGVIDARPLSAINEKVFNFCLPGFGHDCQTWKNIIRALRLVGYDGALCLEHEDRLVGQIEGLTSAYSFLSDMVHTTPLDQCGMHWKSAVAKEGEKHLH